MSYSDFRNIEDVKQRFNLKIFSGDSLFSDTKEIHASQILTEILEENISLALNINTEKARSEFIIAPVLVLPFAHFFSPKLFFKLLKNMIYYDTTTFK